MSKNTEDIKKNVTNISNNTQKITSLETAVSSEKTRAESVENQLKTDLENGKKVWDDKYTKSEVDNKFSTLETNIDWKEAVGTFDDIATTYPTPDDGWTVNVKDTDYTYRYNGGKWVAISANAIPKATNEVDGLMTKEYAKKLDGLTKYTPDGTTITADEDGTLHGADTIQVDGITITRDDATKVIALAKTLQDKIGTIDNKVDQNYVVNNLTTTEQGFVLDGRQGKALQDQITSLNGSLNKADEHTLGGWMVGYSISGAGFVIPIPSINNYNFSSKKIKIFTTSGQDCTSQPIFVTAFGSGYNVFYEDGLPEGLEFGKAFLCQFI